MELIKFLKAEGLTGLINRFNVNVKPSTKYPNLVCLTYNQLKTPKNAITNDCRGIIIDKNTFEIISLPFTRFNDYNPTTFKNTSFDVENFKTYDKIDGSLMSVFYYDGQWNVSSKSTVDAQGLITEVNMTYSDYFWKIWKESNYEFPIDRNITYIFEFKFPSQTQFIVKTDKPSITLIGARNIKNLQEYDIETLVDNWKRVGFERLTLEEVLEKAKKLNPINSEGFVICDDNFNRFKIKSPAYDLIGLLKRHSQYNDEKEVEQNNFKRLCQISKVSDDKDFLKFYENCKNYYKKIISAKKQLAHELYKIKEKITNMTPKELGLFAKNHKLGKVFFQLQKSDSIDDFIFNMDNRVYEDFIKNFIKK